MRKITGFVVSSLIIAVLSCGDSATRLIVGKWKRDSAECDRYGQCRKKAGRYYVVVFMQDGSFYDIGSHSVPMKGTYRIENDVIVFNVGSRLTSELISISSDEMLLKPNDRIEKYIRIRDGDK